jgi:hypothetical protein
VDLYFIETSFTAPKKLYSGYDDIKGMFAFYESIVFQHQEGT